MGRVQLYAGTGRLLYDSGGELGQQTVDRIKSEYNAGVALYYDPDACLVRGQVKLYRGGPEQFVAAYMGDDEEDLLSSFVRGIVEAADEKEWAIRSEVGGNQAVFDMLKQWYSNSESGDFRYVRQELDQLALSPERIESIAEQDGSVELLVPDYETAARTLLFLNRAFDGSRSIAITETTDVPTLYSADIFIRPSSRVDSITPGDRVRESLERHREERTKARIEDGLRKLTSANADHRPSDAQAAVAILESNRVGLRFGLTFSETETDPRWYRNLQWWSFRVSPFAIIVGLVLSVVSNGPLEWLSFPSLPVNSSTVGVASSDLSSLVVGTTVVCIVLVVIALVRNRGERTDRSSETVPNHHQSNITDHDQIEAVEKTVAAITELETVTDRDDFCDQLRSISRQFGMTVHDNSGRSVSIRSAATLGSAFGILSSVLVLFLSYLIGRVIISLLI